MNRLLGIGAVAAVVVGFLSFKKGKMDFKLAAEGETDVEQTLSMFGLTVAEVVEQNIAYKSKKPYGTAQVVIDKYTGELYHHTYDKGVEGFGREDYLHNSYGAYASQLKNFNKWVRLINSHSRGGSSGPGGRCVFIVSLLINRETGEVLRSYQGVESKNAESFEAESHTDEEYEHIGKGQFILSESRLHKGIAQSPKYRKNHKLQYVPIGEGEPIHHIEGVGYTDSNSKAYVIPNYHRGKEWWICGVCGDQFSNVVGKTFQEGIGRERALMCNHKNMRDRNVEVHGQFRFYGFETEDSKKLPPLEKAEITGIASGATMEGLETLLAAESEIDEKDAQTIAKQAWKKIMTHISENPYLIYDEKEYTGCGHGDGGKREHWWMDEAIDYFRNRVSTTDGYFLLENLIVEEFQDKAQNDTWMKGILRSTLTQMKKQADKMDEDDEWEAFINDVRARADEESWRQKWVAESFAAEDELSGDDTFDIIYHAYGKKFADREHLILGKPLDESEIYDEMDAFVAKMAEVFTIEQLRGGHKKAIEVQEVHIARGGGTMLFPALFRGALERKDWWTDLKDKWEADFPTTRPNCKCGAILEWDNLRKAWYCISCPFNTYKAEMDEKVLLCPHCEDAEATEICEWCKGKECKECFKEHMTDCNYCDGEGEIPRSWVSDSGDRWSPPSLDVTDWELCEYCNEGQVCGDEDIPEFSWDAESFSIQKACHRCGNTEKDGKLWWVGSRKGFICSDCSNGGTKYRAESFEASKWAGFCPKCKKWRTTNMSWWYRADGQYVREDVPIGVRLCAKRVTRDGYWKDVDGMPHRCDTPLTKGAESLSAKDCDHDKYNVISASEIVGGRRMSVVCVMCDTRGVGEYQYVSSPLDERPHDLTLKEVLDVKWLAAESDGDKQLENGYQCPDCDEGIVYEETYGEEYEDLFVDGSDTTWKYSKIQTCDLCDYVKKEVISTFCENCGEELFSTGEKGKYEKCTCAFGDDFFDVATPFDDSASFSAESDELEESKKRTKMSAIRTGLAITTFSIVMWNLWTNKKQEKDIADIMDLV